mmetsp:Transcript_24873/g.40687  ORF Transcript_24873/g.40687 Transcript_24873/m.40687 type:complete len:117 (-) Transcript_24873:7-357(-)
MDKIKNLKPMAVLAYGGGANCDYAMVLKGAKSPVICYVESIIDCCGEGIKAADAVWSGSNKVAQMLVRDMHLSLRKMFGFYTSAPSDSWDPVLLTSSVLQRSMVTLFRIAYSQFKN